MGANNSSRKITLVNDDVSGVIQVSGSLAHRLRGQYENNSDVKNIPQKVQDPPEPVVSEKIIVEESIPIQQSNSSTSTENGISPLWITYSEDSHSLISRLKEEKDIDLHLRDEEWRKRIKEREDEYLSLNKLSTEEMIKAVKDTEDLFKRTSSNSCCQNPQEKVYKCYLDNPSQSLRCAEDVKNFVRCVDSHRLQAVTSQ